jgi:hypothetical protein
VIVANASERRTAIIGRGRQQTQTAIDKRISLLEE